MSQTLNFALSLLVYSDTVSSNNPRLRNLDYTRQMTGVTTGKSRSLVFTVAAGATETLVSGVDMQWLYLESDQKVAVKLNGDTDENVLVEPIVAADPDKVGILVKRGQVTSVVVTNKSATTEANVTLLLAE